MNTAKIRAFGVTQNGNYNNDFNKLTLYALVELPPFIDISPAGHIIIDNEGTRRIYNHEDAILSYHQVTSNRATEKIEQIILPILLDEDWNNRPDGTLHKTGITLLDPSNIELDSESMVTANARDKENPLEDQSLKANFSARKYINSNSLVVTKFDKVTPTNPVSNPKKIIVEFSASIPNNCQLLAKNGNGDNFNLSGHAIAIYRLVCQGSPSLNMQTINKVATITLSKPWMEISGHKSGVQIEDETNSPDDATMSTTNANDKDLHGILLDA